MSGVEDKFTKSEIDLLIEWHDLMRRLVVGENVDMNDVHPMIQEMYKTSGSK